MHHSEKELLKTKKQFEKTPNLKSFFEKVKIKKIKIGQVIL